MEAAELAPYFGECRQVATLTNRYGIRNEDWGKPVLICEQPREPLASAWGAFKAFR